MTTETTRECGCSEYNRVICDKRAARGLACFSTMPASNAAPLWLTRSEAVAEATSSGGVARVGLHGLCGTARKWMVVARKAA